MICWRGYKQARMLPECSMANDVGKIAMEYRVQWQILSKSVGYSYRYTASEGGILVSVFLTQS